MERVNRILRHPLWRGSLTQIEELEKDRIYCGHDLDHMLHVARLSYIESLERGLDISRETIYAAALLHDIGRGLEYKEGIPHEDAACAMAETILPECGFCREETEQIVAAISAHRSGGKEQEGLSGILYRADKASRNCYFCKAADRGCNWSFSKRNHDIKR
ncbi:MAG: HD domain-containing protein [Emergencia sp.]|nr:HD domain-containing protein [Emergencia sp.]